MLFKPKKVVKKKVYIPALPVYWQCFWCGKLYPWPQVKIRKYCDRVCRNAEYYHRQKNK